ncbi:helix-turn-helix domain-containing protein [Arthrobacter sp. BE255]|uniref:helix-turn-helix domain-containing protein n=1 Tax=Arthrobacter sp. BE255 TaxID=2817721 RepID=UPI00285736F0|nr:helix-turn-helix domain-containing protein [Arthrobacter sp. BE255]MDR7161795.1 excisionase family DNA binding protein [Arthrobacter sp. BE255]
MAQWDDEMNKTEIRASLPFPKMLTIDEVHEILNLGKPMVYALLRSGELRAAQLGPRRMWRVSEDDLADYLERAYKETQERIAAGTIKAEALEDDE